MATGRTHAKWLTVKVDNGSGTLTDITAYVSTIGQFGLTYDTQDVTALSDAIKNIVIGHPGAPITLGGPIDTVIVTHMAAINGAVTPLTIDLQMGIRSAWDSGEPQFGISGTATSGYLCHGFTVDPNNNTWSASFDVFGAVAPAFGTAAET